MSMRDYADSGIGIVLLEGEILDLVARNIPLLVKAGVIEEDDIESVIKAIKTKDIGCECDLVDNIADLGRYGNITSVYIEDLERFGHSLLDIGEEYDTIYCLWAKKDSPFQKYENIEEIREEIRNTFKENGIEITDELLNSRVGRFTIQYWG